MNQNWKSTGQESRPGAGDVLQFGPFELDRARAALIRDGVEVPLRPKCFDVLRYLAENPSRLVTKEELLAAAWPGVVVTDSSLPQCMVEVRRALGEEAREMIITVPRRGYRFEATGCISSGILATAFEPPLSKGTRMAPAVGLAAAASLLVAGLVVFEPFAAGNLLSETQRIVGFVPDRGRLGPDSSVAYSQYIQGQMFQDRRADGDMQRSIEYFRQAVELDPGFGEAWVGLAGSIWLDAKIRGDRDFATWGPEYKAALDRALEIDPDHAEAHARLANYYLESGEIRLADQHFDLALRTGSDSSLILSMAAGDAFWQRDLQRAVELARRAVELEPLSFVRQSNYATYLFYAGNPALARKHVEIALDLNPQGDVDAEGLLMQSLVLLGDFEAAASVARSLPEGTLREQGLALVNEANGDRPNRDRFLQYLESRTSADAALRLAEIYAYIDQPEPSRYWLEAALRRNATEAAGPCVSEFVIEATLSPFLVKLSVESPGRKPTALEGAQQFANYNCPTS